MARKKKTIQEVIETSIPEGQTLAFDLGFQLPEQIDLETGLGQAAIIVEDISEKLGNAINKPLMQAQTTVSTIQSKLYDDIYQPINQALENTRKIVQGLESQYAAQIAKPFEMVAPIINDEFVNTIISPKNGALPIPGGITTIGPIFPPIIPGTGQPIPGVGVLPPSTGSGVVPRCPPPLGFKLTSPTTAVDGKGGSAVWNPFVNGWTGSVGGILPGQGFGGFSSPCPTTPPPIPPIIPGPPPIPPPDGQILCPPCPPPTVCPPIPKEPPCIKICPPPEPECPEIEYHVYCSSDTGVIYFVPKGENPKSTGDKLVSTGKVEDINFTNILKECKPKSDTKPTTQPPESPIVFQPGIGCEDLFQYLTVSPNVSGEYFNAIWKPKTKEVKEEESITREAAKAIADAIGDKAEQFIRDVANNTASGIHAWFQPNDCPSGTVLPILIGRTLSGFVRKWLSDVMEPVDEQLRYAQNYCAPFALPSAAEAVRAYLTNSIDGDRLNCLLRANGIIGKSYEAVIDSARSRLDVTQSLVAWRREIISEIDLDANLRQLGFLYPIERNALKSLTTQIPNISDLIPMMVRDVADEVNVDWTESDESFVTKWTGDIKKWGEQQGIHPDWAKYAWRYHWQLPSPTQLFEFWARLRHTGKYGTVDQFRERIRKTLIQQDILPAWIDAYLDVATKALTRVDSKRAYGIGAITEQQLWDSFIDGGYSDKNATILVEFTKKQLRDTLIRSPLINQYATGEVSEVELRQDLVENNYSQDLVESVIVGAKKKLRRKKRITCIKAYKKRFLLGEFNRTEIIDKLLVEELDIDQVNQLVESWICEKSNQGKAVPTATLCGWFELGVIDQVEFYQRLLNLGYNADTASKLLVECRLRLGIKSQREEQKRIAQLRREQEKQQRQAGALARQLAGDIEKQLVIGEKNRKVQERRQKWLIEAADKFSKHSLIPLADSAVGIKRIVNRLVASGIAGVDLIHQGAVEISDNADIVTLDDFSQQLAQLMTVV